MFLAIIFIFYLIWWQHSVFEFRDAASSEGKKVGKGAGIRDAEAG